LSLHLPAAFPNDIPASQSQLDGVRRFYASCAITSLTAEQAGDLLDYREVARAVVAILAKNLYGEAARASAEAAAILISRDREIAAEVITLMLMLFHSGADPDGLPRAVRRMNCFDALADHVDV
jgi:predicted Zn-dependent protease